MYHTAIYCIPVVVRVCRPSQSFPNRASGEGQDGSDPLFFAAGAARRRGVWHQVYHLVYHTPTAVGGVAPVLNYPCGKAQPPAQARDWTRRRAARCVTGFSACSSSSAASVPWPRGRGRACAPRPIPAPFWCATTRRMCPRPSSSGTTSRRTWPCNSSADVLSARPGSGAPGWAAGWGSARAFSAGHFRPRSTARPSSSARDITRHTDGEPLPGLAHNPGAGPLSRRGDVRGRLVRENLRLYATLPRANSCASRTTIPSGAGPRACLT